MMTASLGDGVRIGLQVTAAAIAILSSLDGRDGLYVRDLGV